MPISKSYAIVQKPEKLLFCGETKFEGKSSSIITEQKSSKNKKCACTTF